MRDNCGGRRRAEQWGARRAGRGAAAAAALEAPQLPRAQDCGGERRTPRGSAATAGGGDRGGGGAGRGSRAAVQEEVEEESRPLLGRARSHFRAHCRFLSRDQGVCTQAPDPQGPR